MKINLDQVKDLTPKYKRGGASRRRTLREGIDKPRLVVYHPEAIWVKSAQGIWSLYMNLQFKGITNEVTEIHFDNDLGPGYDGYYVFTRLESMIAAGGSAIGSASCSSKRWSASSIFSIGVSKTNASVSNLGFGADGDARLVAGFRADCFFGVFATHHLHTI
jgi:hypothetical protein